MKHAHFLKPIDTRRLCGLTGIMSLKASAMLSAILSELPHGHPLLTQLRKAAVLVKDLETHCDDLTQDSRKMAKRMTILDADLAILQDKLAAGR